MVLSPFVVDFIIQSPCNNKTPLKEQNHWCLQIRYTEFWMYPLRELVLLGPIGSFKMPPVGPQEGTQMQLF
jgi:hypothetical protein